MHRFIASQVACELAGIGPVHLETLQVAVLTHLPLRGSKPALQAKKISGRKVQPKAARAWQAGDGPKEHAESLHTWCELEGILPVQSDALHAGALMQVEPLRE